MPRTRVKICGITTVDDALAAVRAGADAIGFVLWPGSPRVVVAAEAHRIALALPPFVTTVGLFVDATAEHVREAVATVPSTVAQSPVAVGALASSTAPTAYWVLFRAWVAKPPTAPAPKPNSIFDENYTPPSAVASTQQPRQQQLPTTEVAPAPAITSSRSALSATVVVIGPVWSMVASIGITPV